MRKEITDVSQAIAAVTDILMAIIARMAMSKNPGKYELKRHIQIVTAAVKLMRQFDVSPEGTQVADLAKFDGRVDLWAAQYGNPMEITMPPMYGTTKTAGDALLFLAECVFATIESLTNLSRPPKQQLVQQIGAGQVAYDALVKFNVDLSGATSRALAVQKAGGSVQAWADSQ
ncbi:hypothetical protein HNP46_006361 [Pseudomonas nitritireducens]|uniref:Uncharacterized protein n=1 Tax=Pseudomonas nitroreducens TaxID=46680 RepID=A0A7W7KS20_PSENT|nr:hypothetical protein [Pseudomonas nitritireducens]MBB4867448.1 hypothetical protein [Pseudomonas nitritireducens]